MTRKTEANRCEEYRSRGSKIIPGLTQLLSKRPDQFAPGVWPTFFKKAKGVEIWDLDNHKYIDMSIMGIGANVLGYCDPDVDTAIKKIISSGNSSTLVGPEEVELAELLCSLHPWAKMARFCRGGGEAMAVAVRIARAASGRDVVAFCGYHGWHDWYLAANLTGEKLDGHLLPGLAPKGVPLALKGTALPFRYNQIDELEQIVKQHGAKLGVIVIESIRDQQPRNGFLQQVREIANKTRTVLICDEVSAGFRLNCGGSHLLFNINPDIAVFAKAISNGYPMGAVIGTREVMDVAQETFISSTYWTERIGPAAALATIRKYKRCKVHEHLIEIGDLFQNGMKKIATETGVEIETGGISPLSHFNFKSDKNLAMMTLFVQEMLKAGFLASYRFYSSYSHKREHVEIYLKAAKTVFRFLKTLGKKKNYEDFLKGSVATPGFSRLT